MLRFLKQCLFTAVMLILIVVNWIWKKITGKDLLDWRM